MSLSTPAAPVDVAAAFPEFAGQERTTVRLHPRRGAPGPGESSLGGPLLWPAGEPWPTCADPDHDDNGALEDDPAQPVPMVPVLQLYKRDVPELPFPEGTDLCQVLWCPGCHDPAMDPLPLVRWRAAADVGIALAGAPRPPEGFAWEEYLPKPCVLTPERVREHQTWWELGADLRDRIGPWAEARGLVYRYHLGAAYGTKVGGWPDWIQDPDYPDCACGRPMTHLLTVASGEWDGESWKRWAPVEELPADGGRPTAGQDAAGLCLGDAGSMYLLTCTHCAERPVAAVVQCS